jgi:hypothetical protein
MSLRCDNAGLESLPLKLMVVAVVASLSIIPAAEALNGMRTREFIRKAELQLATIVACVETLTVEGPGNVRTISLDFRGEGTVGFSRLTIGDAKDGANVSSIILELRSGAFIIKMADQPPAWMCSSAGRSLQISSPVLDLRMSSHLSDQTDYVLVEAC